MSVKNIILVISITSLIACVNENSNAPCEWDEKKFSATVTDIKFDKMSANGDSLFRVMMMFDAGSLSDQDQDLGKLRNMEINREKLNQNKIKVNATYTGRINDLKTGNCETPIVAFDQRLK